ncbi:MAG: type I-E CRISPR-associated endoribonuclease Cas2e [Pseudoramibacter sp.]|jgi:CRISPR-associated protein Cas2
MVVIVIENAPDMLRGTITRWLQEVKPGVFVGKVNALVRSKLWEKICTFTPAVSSVIIYSAQTEQGYAFEVTGDPHRTVIDLDGIQLIKIQ